MQRIPHLTVKPMSSVTPAMRDIQEEIAGLYRGLLEMDAGTADQADEIIQRARRLEQQLIDMRSDQPGYCMQSEAATVQMRGRD